MSLEKLRAALAAEHAAIFAYGRLGVLLDAAGKTEAHAAEAAHRTRRDALVVLLDQAKASPVPADPAYALPFPLVDRDSALKLAVHVEDGVTATWHSALNNPDAAIRSTALESYSDAAVRATRWRKIAGVTPLTSAFPGRVG